MMRNNIAHPFEPEPGQLRQHFPFVRDAGAQHEVKCRDAIGRDDEKRCGSGRQGYVIDVADLAAPIERQTFECSFEQGCGGEHCDLARDAKAYGTLAATSTRLMSGATD